MQHQNQEHSHHSNKSNCRNPPSSLAASSAANRRSLSSSAFFVSADRLASAKRASSCYTTTLCTLATRFRVQPATCTHPPTTQGESSPHNLLQVALATTGRLPQPPDYRCPKRQRLWQQAVVASPWQHQQPPPAARGRTPGRLGQSTSEPACQQHRRHAAAMLPPSTPRPSRTRSELRASRAVASNQAGASEVAEGRSARAREMRWERSNAVPMTAAAGCDRRAHVGNSAAHAVHRRVNRGR